MNNIDIFTKKPSATIDTSKPSRFEKFNLRENPFPSTPFVSQGAADARSNGSIYDMSIRESVLERIKKNFLSIPQTDQSHPRLGYIMDTSHIGRGNGKTAFILNLIDIINKSYCLDLSNSSNRCFGLYLSPKPSGVTSTFERFVDQMFDAICQTTIIDSALATIRLTALLSLISEFNVAESFNSINDLVDKVNNKEWLGTKVNLYDLQREINKNPYIQALPLEFPVRLDTSSIALEFPQKSDFYTTYKRHQKFEHKLQFLFSDMVNFFIAANFNGAYIFVDNYELIPDFQTARQKKDFAYNLRQCLFDGMYVNSRVGFFNMFLVLHAGVPRLIEESWGDSGLENRVPLKSVSDSHIIRFENISKEHAVVLIKKYLNEYRIEQTTDELYPFDADSIQMIAEANDVNAAKILKAAHKIIELAADNGGVTSINKEFACTCLQRDQSKEVIKEQKITSIKSDSLSKIVEE